MALNCITGHTDDGLVFLQFTGAQQINGKPVQSTITLEPDMAADIGKKIIEAANRAIIACKRPLIVGQDQAFKKG